MQGLGSPDEDRDGGFEHGGWSAPYVDEAHRLFLHPLLLGTVKRPFHAMDHPHRLRLLDAAPTTTGVLMLTYATER